MAGFEPAASCSQSRRANQAALHPVLLTCENSGDCHASQAPILLTMLTRLFPRDDLGPIAAGQLPGTIVHPSGGSRCGAALSISDLLPGYRDLVRHSSPRSHAHGHCPDLNLDGMDDFTAADDQVEAIARGARHLLGRSRERAHILSAVLQVFDQYDTVSATMRASESADAGKYRVAELLGLDQRQAGAVAGITMGMLPQREHRQMVEDHEELVARIADLESVLASPERQRGLVGTKRGSYLAEQGSE